MLGTIAAATDEEVLAPQLNDLHDRNDLPPADDPGAMTIRQVLRRDLPRSFDFAPRHGVRRA